MSNMRKVFIPRLKWLSTISPNLPNLVFFWKGPPRSPGLLNRYLPHGPIIEINVMVGTHGRSIYLL